MHVHSKLSKGITTCFLTLSLWAANTLNATTVPQTIGNFDQNGLTGWKEKSFQGNTDYRLVNEGDSQVLKAHTVKSASLLYKEKTVDVSKNPVLNWSWKVDRIYKNIDEKSRLGDDFPARLYVVVKTGFLPWDTLAINYVWSSNNAEGESWYNPFTDKAKMIVVQSGESQTGQWVSESRNVVQDFKDKFGIDIRKLDGYAVMVDGDNSGQEGIAWFGAINFLPAS